MRKTLIRKACASACYSEQLAELNPQGLATMRTSFDPHKSSGSTFVDADGKSYLDAFMHISSIPLGYNNADLRSAITDNADVITHIISRSAVGIFPPSDLPELLKKPLEVAPPGMKHVQNLMCGTCSVENALKTAFGHFADRKRKGRPHTQEELESCMKGQAPGSTQAVALSFKGCFHGRSFGVMSMTNSKAAIKVDMPAFEWPHATFPTLKYPLEENIRENEEEEARCLAEVEQIIEDWAGKGKPVACMITEPILAEGGDRYASDDFFRKLVAIAKKNGIYFIADEVQTGVGATGKMWAHEWWGLDSGVDMVTFAKKAQACGFYYTDELISNPNTRIFNTWMGDPVKLVLMNKVIEVIQRDSLLKHSLKLGDYLINGLRSIENESNGFVNSTRGRGLFSAINFETSEQRDKVVKKMMDKGVLVGPAGSHAIRFRPHLKFSESETDMLLENLRTCVKEL